MKENKLKDMSIDTIYKVMNDIRSQLSNVAQENNVRFEGGAGLARCLFISTLIVQLNAKLVYETGFNIGGTAGPTADALRFTEGKFVGFEIDRGKQVVVDKFLSMFPNAEMVWGDSQQTLEKRWKETQEQPDLFFVDGGHSEQVCTCDFNHALKIVRPGGIIMVDDISNPPVSNVIHQLIPSTGSMWFEGIHQGTGVVIYQKPTG